MSSPGAMLGAALLLLCPLWHLNSKLRYTCKLGLGVVEVAMGRGCDNDDIAGRGKGWTNLATAVPVVAADLAVPELTAVTTHAFPCMTRLQHQQKLLKAW